MWSQDGTEILKEESWETDIEKIIRISKQPIFFLQAISSSMMAGACAAWGWRTARPSTWLPRPGGQTTFFAYVVICGLCAAQYTGQTTKTMRARHFGHHSEVKRKEDGVGAHFHQHAEDLGINLNTDMEDIMKHFNLTVIASVEPDIPWSGARLDNLESEIIDRMMTMENYGGYMGR
jgi:hypothetical protein